MPFFQNIFYGSVSVYGDAGGPGNDWLIWDSCVLFRGFPGLPISSHCQFPWIAHVFGLPISSDCPFSRFAHFLRMPISSDCPFPRIAALFHSAELKNLHSMLRHRGTLFTRPTCCNTLQHIATHTATFDVQTWGHTPHVANTLQHTQQHTAQHTAAHAATHRTTHCNTLHNTL